MIAKEMLNRVLDGQRLDRADAKDWMLAVLRSEVSEVQLAAMLGGLRTRGETTSEVLGFYDALMANAKTIDLEHDTIVDTCGTGGDGLGTFNISTAVAVVVASGGVGVAKHGNRSVSSQSGSSDVLEAAGVPITPDTDALRRAFDQTGLAFLFAPFHHPTLKAVAPVRKSLGVMTVFNLLGPLVNPAPLTHQYVGVPRLDFHAQYGDIFAERRLPAAIVHGRDGADEALPGGPFHICRTTAEGDQRTTIENPANYGVGVYPLSAFKGAGPVENAETLWALLEGQGPEALRDAIALNAGLVFDMVGKAEDPTAGVATARELILDGAPARLLRDYIHALGAA